MKMEKKQEGYEGVLRNQNNPSYSENTAVPDEVTCSWEEACLHPMSVCWVTGTAHHPAFLASPILVRTPGLDQESIYVSYTLKVPKIILYMTERGKSGSECFKQS